MATVYSPGNFNFGVYWNTLVRPWLDDIRVKAALKEGMDSYLSNTVYVADTCPASYSSADYYSTLIERREEDVIATLRRNGQLPRSYLLLEEIFHRQEGDDSNPLYDEARENLCEAREELLEPYFSWQAIKYDLLSYYVFGSCHAYAPTFQLTLARLVCPEEKWRVQAGTKHSTVINDSNTKVFDLLYWALDGRLENYIFGDDLEANDPTLGGHYAYVNSLSSCF